MNRTQLQPEAAVGLPSLDRVEQGPGMPIMSGLSSRIMAGLTSLTLAAEATAPALASDATRCEGQQTALSASLLEDSPQITDSGAIAFSGRLIARRMTDNFLFAPNTKVNQEPAPEPTPISAPSPEATAEPVVEETPTPAAPEATATPEPAATPTPPTEKKPSIQNETVEPKLDEEQCADIATTSKPIRKGAKKTAMKYGKNFKELKLSAALKALPKSCDITRLVDVVPQFSFSANGGKRPGPPWAGGVRQKAFHKRFRGPKAVYKSITTPTRSSWLPGGTTCAPGPGKRSSRLHVVVEAYSATGRFIKSSDLYRFPGISTKKRSRNC